MIEQVAGPHRSAVSPESLSVVIPCEWEALERGEHFLKPLWVSLVAQMVKNLPAMQEAWVQSLDGNNSLEEDMATHSSTLSWRIPWTEESGGLQSMGSKRVRHN